MTDRRNNMLTKIPFDDIENFIKKNILLIFICYKGFKFVPLVLKSLHLANLGGRGRKVGPSDMVTLRV